MNNAGGAVTANDGAVQVIDGDDPGRDAEHDGRRDDGAGRAPL